MTSLFQHKHYVITIIGSIIPALFVYSVLSYLFVAPRITIPVSIIISTLVFGLTRYYAASHVDIKKTQAGYPSLRASQENGNHSRDHKKKNGPLSSILFVTIFIIVILISSLTLKQDFHIFINWSEIGGMGIIQLGAAIMLCFFIPGYAMVLIITKKYKIDPILAVLLAYLLSMLITGITAYISALSFDSAISETKNLFIIVYLGILVSFLIYYPRYRVTFPVKLQIEYYFYYHFVEDIVTKYRKYLRTRASELLVFGSLFMLIIVSTYILYGGITIGDQWYHQGRALLFMSGSFREAALSHAETFYPPFQSALLAALTSLSGMPLVNAYASIAFLNAIPMFAFYYFFLTWVTAIQRKAALLACSLFTLSSGFGWIYLLTNTPQPIISEHSSLEALRTVGHLDIVSTSNFVIPTAPDFSTGLIYIALPAGFVLLGMLQTRFHTEFINIFLVTAISILGIISHYEFYIFILIASVLPPIFKMKARNYVYVGFLIAISIVYLIGIITPGNFFTSLEIVGFSLLLLVGLFVITAWAIYMTGGYLHKFLEHRLISLKALKKLLYHKMRFNFITITIIIFLVAYVYLLSFIMLSQLSLDTIRDHTSQSNVPWYLYPMRLGIAGLLGLVFILSYIFKSFEKQVFVFGIIVVISLITGPYYSESRFSKYVMVGMIGFASLMFYKILIWRSNFNLVRNIILIGSIIICSGLSMLIFTGYNSLILQTEDYINTLARRHFPSMLELHLFEVLHDMVDVDSKKYNVIGFSNEYDQWKDGLMSKIQSFAGLPYGKLFQSPLTLNASTLDALYRHLDYSDARYIVLPKDSIQFGNMMAEPISFAIDHFRHAYEDNDNIILEVPDISPPTTGSNRKLAVVYSQPDHLHTDVTDVHILQYDNKTFNFEVKGQDLPVQIVNQTQGIVMYGSKSSGESTLWSKQFSPKIKVNSFEAGFRILPEYGNKSSNSDVNLKWRQGGMDYYTKLSENGLELFQKHSSSQQFEILKNTEVKIKDWMLYRLKIESLNNSISIYVNDIPKIQISDPIYKNKAQAISRIGLSSNNYNAEFTPVTIWNESQVRDYDKNQYFDYYYPLSLLALSKTNYDIFRDNDLSVFSNDVIFVPDDLTLDETTFNEYMHYVQMGGTLIPINSDNHFNGTFSKLFYIQSNGNKSESYTSIISNNNQSLTINIPGVTRAVQIKSNDDEKILATYHNDDSGRPVAPFAIEKKFDNGGRIVLVNAEGYFNTISNSPSNYFLSLSNITKLLSVDLKTTSTASHITSLPMRSFTGDLEVLGNVTLSTTSLSIAKNVYPHSLDIDRISVVDTRNHSQTTYNNSFVNDLKLVGNADIMINLTGALKLPDMISNRNYIGVSIPSKFNVTIQLAEESNSQIEIFRQNNGVVNTIRGSNGSTINLYNVKAQSPIGFIPVLLKEPQLTVEGRTIIKEPYFYGYFNDLGQLSTGSPIDFEGKLNMKFHFVDDYNEPFYSATSTQFISYLQSVTMTESTAKPDSLLKIPGDISADAKMKGEDIPLEKILKSPINLITLAVLVAVTVTGTVLIRRYDYRFS